MPCRHVQGRSMLPMLDKQRSRSLPRAPGFRALSYNLLADCNADRARAAPNLLSWSYRCPLLLQQLLNCEADILALQDVEFYEEHWRTELNRAGFDTAFKRRTGASGTAHREGVLIAWRRSLFQLVRSSGLELNSLAAEAETSLLKGRAAVADNVALMVQLLPWQRGRAAPAGLCIACAQLAEPSTAPVYTEVQTCDPLLLLQARGLARAVEQFNADLNLPLLLCGTFNALPDTPVYQSLCRGQREHNFGPPLALRKPPSVKVLSCTSVELTWFRPEAPGTAQQAELLPLLSYTVLWDIAGEGSALECSQTR